MRKKSIISFILLLPLILGAGLMLYRCIPVDSELSGTVKVEQDINVAAATGTVTGRVVSANPHEPIEGATVDLIVNGAKRTTTSATSTDEDLKGYFSFGGVPANVIVVGVTVGYTLNISATGYADFTTRVAVPQSFDNTPVTVDLGTIGLGEVFDLAVVVVDEDGIPVAAVKVFAVPTGNACGVITTGVGWGVSSASYISATSDSSGIATLANLNECYTYNIIAPAFDADADGVIDYTTSIFAYAGAVVSDETCSLLLATARPGQAIAVVASSLVDEPAIPIFNLSTITDDGITVQTATLASTTMGPSDSITVVFNYPVALTGDVDISYSNWLTNPFDGTPAAILGYGLPILVANTAAMDSTGCILTITPTATLPENVWLRFEGSVTAHTAALLEDDYLNFANADGFPYNVYVHTAAGITATPTITADNYDGISSTSFNIATGIAYTLNGAPNNPVYIECPEYVNGNIRVIEYTQIARAARPVVAATAATATDAARVITVADPAFTAVTTVVNWTTIAINTLDDMVYTDGVQTRSRVGIAAPFYIDILNTGTTAGTYYRANTGINLMDGDTITFELDIQDANGTHYYSTLTKTVE